MLHPLPGAQLARLQHLLRTVASRHRIAVLMTNLAVPAASNEDDAAAAAGAPRATKPALGVAWQHRTDVRLQLGEASTSASASASASAAPPSQSYGQSNGQSHGQSHGRAQSSESAGARYQHGAHPPSLSPPTPHLPRTVSVLKSSLAARGVMEGESAAAVLSATGLFV